MLASKKVSGQPTKECLLSHYRLHTPLLCIVLFLVLADEKWDRCIDSKYSLKLHRALITIVTL